MYGSYRKSEAFDPETFAASAAAIFSEYPPEVVAFVTDPRTGLARRSKFPPQLSEVSDACQELVDRHAAAARRDRDRRLQIEDRERILDEDRRRADRPSYDELVDRCAKVGLIIGSAADQRRAREEPIKAEAAAALERLAAERDVPIPVSDVLRARIADIPKRETTYGGRDL